VSEDEEVEVECEDEVEVEVALRLMSCSSKVEVEHEVDDEVANEEGMTKRTRSRKAISLNAENECGNHGCKMVRHTAASDVESSLDKCGITRDLRLRRT